MSALVWNLVGGPCEGSYGVESCEAAPERIRAVHGDGPPAVLDLPGDQPTLLETEISYRLVSKGWICTRGRGGGCELVATYVPADWPDEWAMQAFRGEIEQAQRYWRERIEALSVR